MNFSELRVLSSRRSGTKREARAAGRPRFVKLELAIVQPAQSVNWD